MGIDPGYVLDRMEVYELKALMEYDDRRNRDSWEQTRLLAFVNARCAGAKVKDLKDLFELPWDKEIEPELSKRPASPQEEARLRATARYLLENGLMG